METVGPVQIRVGRNGTAMSTVFKCGSTSHPASITSIQCSDQGPPHMQEYCEMCQRLGYNCCEFSTDVLEDDNDAESVVSTISTVSSNTPTESDNEEWSVSESDTEEELADDFSNHTFY